MTVVLIKLLNCSLVQGGSNKATVSTPSRGCFLWLSIRSMLQYKAEKKWFSAQGQKQLLSLADLILPVELEV